MPTNFGNVSLDSAAHLCRAQPSRGRWTGPPCLNDEYAARSLWKTTFDNHRPVSVLPLSCDMPSRKFQLRLHTQRYVCESGANKPAGSHSRRPLRRRKADHTEAHALGAIPGPTKPGTRGKRPNSRNMTDTRGKSASARHQTKDAAPSQTKTQRERESGETQRVRVRESQR